MKKKIVLFLSLVIAAHVAVAGTWTQWVPLYRHLQSGRPVRQYLPGCIHAFWYGTTFARYAGDSQLGVCGIPIVPLQMPRVCC